MCGICGKISKQHVEEAELRRMAQAIVHRGPDDEGYYVNGQAGLGSRRLSIIDLDRGHMPISNEDQSIWITYNGEIYNYPSLREDLLERGHTFATDSDTEVIVHLYEEFGERCVDKLSGMFAFAIWDARQRKLMLARDRIGQKPLFYAQANGDFYFASEIKSILAANGIKREIDYEAMHHYLSLRFIPAPLTMMRNIRKLPPAHYLVYQNGQYNVRRYWELDFRQKTNLSDDEAVELLGEKLSDVVDAHLISDVPVGAFLSGGMDSSMIVAMMARNSPDQFETFAVGVEEQDFNELPYARLVAEHYDTCHTEQCVESDLIKLLPRIVWHLDEPSDPIAACMFHAAALASQHVKVVLGGDGGDELFAGFDRYLGLIHLHRYAMMPSLLRQRLFGPIVNSLPDSFTYKSLTQKLRWVNQLSNLPNDGTRYAEATIFFRFGQQDKRVLYGDWLLNQVGDINSAEIIVQEFEKPNADDIVDRMLYADFMTRLPEHSLMLTDRMTMAHSLEARSPFLDHTLVEFMATLPSNMKIRGRQLKYVLRKAAEGYLPETIVTREKQGFMFPIAYWFKNELSAFVTDFLLDSFFVREGIFKQEAVLDLITDHRNGRVDNHVRLWMLLNLAVWHQIYIEQNDVSSVVTGVQKHLGVRSP